MNYQISTTLSRKKAKARLKELEKIFLSNKESNAYFLNTFDPARTLYEIDQISWSSLYPLAYSFYSLKNLISHDDALVTGGSKFLDGYIPPFNSTVYKALKKEKSICVIDSNLDEFGMGCSGLDSQYGIVKNPINELFITGGSSSGSSYLVNKKWVNFSIASDTGDSARLPASMCNVYGFKPSYGSVSRYGFFPFCSQFDAPAVIANSIHDISLIFSKISFFDPHDLNTVASNNRIAENYDFSKIRIAFLKGTMDDNQDPNSEKISEEFKKLLVTLNKDKNITVTEIEFDLKLLRLSSLIYKVVSYAESVSNYLNLNGLIFPYTNIRDNVYMPVHKENIKNYEELLLNSRKLLGKEFVFRQIIGMYFLDEDNYENIYLKSKKILGLINDRIGNIFENYDLIISPTTSNISSTIEDYKPVYTNVNTSNILLFANFCGLPAISIPWIFVDKMPVGIHLMAKHNNDNFLLRAAKYIEEFWISSDYK